jgi:hypothetical protein
MSQDPPVMIAMAPCHLHGGIFSFDPDRVQSLLIDPATGRPPDVDEDNQRMDRDAPGVEEAFARSVQTFLCPACCKKLNELLAARGEPPRFDETDTSGGQVQR